MREEGSLGTNWGPNVRGRVLQRHLSFAPVVETSIYRSKRQIRRHSVPSGILEFDPKAKRPEAAPLPL